LNNGPCSFSQFLKPKSLSKGNTKRNIQRRQGRREMMALKTSAEEAHPYLIVICSPTEQGAGVLNRGQYLPVTRYTSPSSPRP
jgi:hypothetical protein